MGAYGIKCVGGNWRYICFDLIAAHSKSTGSAERMKLHGDQMDLAVL